MRACSCLPPPPPLLFRYPSQQTSLVAQRVQANFTSAVELVGGLAGALSMLGTTQVSRTDFEKFVTNSKAPLYFGVDGGAHFLFCFSPSCSFSSSLSLSLSPHETWERGRAAGVLVRMPASQRIPFETALTNELGRTIVMRSPPVRALIFLFPFLDQSLLFPTLFSVIRSWTQWSRTIRQSTGLSAGEQ